MINVMIKLNSYMEDVKFFVDGKQTSMYGDMGNYEYEHVINTPEVVLASIARYLNDDYALQVMANPYEYYVIKQAATENEYCYSCVLVPLEIQLTTKERVKRIEGFLPHAKHTVLVSDDVYQDDILYDNIHICFTSEPTVTIYLDLRGIPSELIICASETLLVNNCIGKIIKSQINCPDDIAICANIEPIVRVKLPDIIELGDEVVLDVQLYPENAKIPDISIISSNKDVILPEGLQIATKNTGKTEIQIFKNGENSPVLKQTVEVIQTIYVSEIKVKNFHYKYKVGDTLILDIETFPSNAIDENEINIRLLNNDREYVPTITSGKKIILKDVGSFYVEITTRKAKWEKEIHVVPVLQRLRFYPEDLNLTIGDKRSLFVNFIPEDAVNKNIFWKTSNPSVAKIIIENDTYKVEALDIGSCKITCCSENDDKISFSRQVTVNPVPKKRLPIIPIAIIILAVALFLIIKPALAVNPNDIGENNSISYTEKYPEATPVDVFDGVDFTIEGNSGEAAIAIQYLSDDDFIRNCSFEFSKKTGLSNGDTIIVSAIAEDTVVEMFNSVPMESTKQITVSGLAEYIFSADEIPESFLDEATKCYLEYIDRWNGGGFGITYSNAEHYATYFITNTKTNDTWLAIVCCYDQFRDGAYEETNYCINWFENLAVNENGEASTSPDQVDDYDLLSYDSMMDSVFFEEKEYVTVKIK